VLESWDDEDLFDDPPWNQYKSDSTWDPDINGGAFRPYFAPRNLDYQSEVTIIMYATYILPGVSEGDAILGDISKPDGGVVTISGSDGGSAPPTSTAPPITAGAIKGILRKSGDWASDFDSIMTKPTAKIGLFQTWNDGTRVQIKLTSDGPNCVGGGDDFRNPDTKSTTVGDSYIFSFLVECVEGKALYEGNYGLYFAYSESGDWTGDATPDNFTMPMNVDFTGSINFSLKNQDPVDGSGIYTFLDATGTYEPTSPAKSTNDASPEESIWIDVTETSAIEGTFADIMNRAINIVLSAVTWVVEWGGNQIHQMLIWGNDIEVDPTGATTGAAGIRTVWENTRNMGLSLLTMVLILVAFANILGINLDRYGVTKIIPKIIIAIVMTYFSFIIVTFLLDFMSALQALLFQGASQGSYFQLSSQINGVISGQVAGISPEDILQMIPQLLFLEILAVCIAIVIIWLLLVLVVRNAMIFILVSVAPIAFLAMILPFTEKYYKQWWATFWKWAFIGPAIAFMLWLTQQFFAGYGASAFGSAASDMPKAWTFLIAAAVMIWLTATLPLKMGNEVYGTIKDKAWGNKHNPIKNRLDMYKQNKDAGRTMKLREKQAKLASGKLGFMTGMNKKQRAAERGSLIADIQKEYGQMSNDEVLGIAKEKGIRAEAAQNYLASIGRLKVEDDAEFAERMHKRSQENNAFGGLLADKQKDFSAQVVLATQGRNTKALEDLLKAVREGNAADLKANHFKAVDMHGGADGGVAMDRLRNDEYRSESFMKAAKGADAMAFGYASRKRTATTRTPSSAPAALKAESTQRNAQHAAPPGTPLPW
jgi:hypothetical protein